MPDPLDLDELAREVADGNFLDARLTSRLEALIRGIGRDPEASFPRLFDKAGLEATYRFFSNVVVRPAAVLAPHYAATKARVEEVPRVLVLHDTTDCTFRHDGSREGFGEGEKQSFSAHVSLVIAADGSRKPLGVAGVDSWVKNGAKKQAATLPRAARRRGRKAKEDSSNEPSAEELRLREEALASSVWLRQIEQTAKVLGCGTKAIHVCDRAADDYATFWRLSTTDQRFVIRSKNNRLVDTSQKGKRRKLTEVLATLEHTSERAAWINGRAPHSSLHRKKLYPAREPRGVKLHLAATRIVLPRPAHYGRAKRPHLGHLPETLEVNVVRVWEPEPPEGAEPIEWVLITNEPIDTAADVAAIVDHYRARWTIEEYFKALKTGCSFERRQLQDYESLINAFAVFAPLAYRMLLLRMTAHDTPEAPPTLVISETELAVLRSPLARRKLPPIPTARDIMLAIAALGGHIQYAPDPGWLTIARGYETLEKYAAAWAVAKNQTRKFKPSYDQR